MKKYFLYDYLITDSRLIKRLETSKYFAVDTTKEDLYGNIYITYKFTGYTQPLLCHITNNDCMVYSPYNYSGNYTYNGENVITLHSTYGRVVTYKLLNIFGVTFMVNSRLDDEDAVLSAETDYSFIESLLKSL